MAYDVVVVVDLLIAQPPDLPLVAPDTHPYQGYPRKGERRLSGRRLPPIWIGLEARQAGDSRVENDFPL